MYVCVWYLVGILFVYYIAPARKSSHANCWRLKYKLDQKVIKSTQNSLEFSMFLWYCYPRVNTVARYPWSWTISESLYLLLNIHTYMYTCICNITIAIMYIGVFDKHATWVRGQRKFATNKPRTLSAKGLSVANFWWPRIREHICWIHHS